MRQQFQKTFDQVRMSPDQVDRVRRTLVQRAEARPRRRGRRLPVLAALAGAAVLLMGAAAVWQSGLLRYFQLQGGSTPEDLSQYVRPIQVSAAGESGWTLTVNECMGDDQWVYVWMTLTAPEGVELPVLEEGQYFELHTQLSDEEGELIAALGKQEIYDDQPGDRELTVAQGYRPEDWDEWTRIPRLEVSQLLYFDQADRGPELYPSRAVWDVDLVIEDLDLSHPDTSTVLAPEVPVPYLDQQVTLETLKVTPFSISAQLTPERPMSQSLDGLLRENAGSGEPYPDAYPNAEEERRRQYYSLFILEDNLTVEVRMRDGTALTLKAVPWPEEDFPLWDDSAHDTLRYAWDYFAPSGSANWGMTAFLDPSQIEVLVFNGVEIPFTFAPEA